MLKIIYAGTPDFAVPALEALAASKHQLVAVFSQPDRRAGRGRKLQQSAVKAYALEKDIPVFQPASFKQPEDVQQVIDLNADLMVVAAYGLLLPKSILKAPRLGCINIHASLLPRWRGAAPIQRAILAGDTHSGITIMQMDAGLDTGDILSSQSVAISPDWNAGDLNDGLKELGAELLMSTIEKMIDGDFTAKAQDDAQATYADKLSKMEAEIDWQKDAEQLSREVRAFVPWPVSFSQIDGKILRIWRASVVKSQSIDPPGRVIEHNRQGIFVKCGADVLQITELQFAGKNKCNAAQALNGKDLSGLSFAN